MHRLRRLDKGRLALLGLLMLGAVAFLAREQWWWVAAGDEPITQGAVPLPAPVIDKDTYDASDMSTVRLYRVSPDGGSSASYHVQEQLGGVVRTTVGTTTRLAGEILIDTETPSLSRAGEFVVNVEVLQSDSRLRDKRIRHDFLESSHWPFVRFEPTLMEGMPDEVPDGTPFDITVAGNLTIKDTTLPVSFSGPVVVQATRLDAALSALISGSAYGVGPIHLARLAQTNDKIVLVLNLVADRVDLTSVADEFARVPVSRPDIPAGGFSATVQPILETKCVHCHSEGGPGWSTVALDKAEDAAEIAQGIALVTEIGYMPPWVLSDVSVPVRHDWSLSDAEIAALKHWAETGGGLDIPPDTPLAAPPSATVRIEEDQVIPPRDGPYSSYITQDGQPLLRDDYRCQVHVVADPEGDGTWLKGLDYHPGERSVVHHIVVFHVPAAAQAEIAKRIAADDAYEAANVLGNQPGWSCFGLSGLVTPGVRDIHAWARGGQPMLYPEGYGIYLAPGDLLVNQVHYHYDHDTPSDSSLLVLDVATEEEARVLVEIEEFSYLTPAEIPCTPEEAASSAAKAAADSGYTDLCLRENVLAEIAQKYNRFASTIPDLLLRQCRGTVGDYDDLVGTVNRSRCDLTIKHPGTLHALWPHMHDLGKSYRLTLNPGTSYERVLIDIPVWDFEWQFYYVPTEDIRVRQGDVFRIECWWDRSLRHMPEPRYVIWNEGTIEEMCYTNVWTVPE